MLGKIRRNWAKYLALVIAVIFIGFIGVYAIMKPGWKEYKGDGFSIKYPPSWDLEEVVKEPASLSGHFLDGWEILLNISHTSTLSEPNTYYKVVYVADSLIRLLRIPKEKFSTDAVKRLTTGSLLDRDYFIDSKDFVYHISSETALRRGVFYSLYYGLLGQIVVSSFQAISGQ